MEVNEVEISWARKALRFIGRKRQGETYVEWITIMKENMVRLKTLSQADHVLIIRKEDELTASIILPDENSNIEHIDPFVIEITADVDEPLYINAAADSLDKKLVNLLDSANSVVLLPLNEVDIQGCLVLAWAEDFRFSNDFKEFVEACLERIREDISLSRTHYSLEELKVRFNSILQAVPQSIAFMDNTGQNSWINDKASKLFSLPGGNVSPHLLSSAMHKLRSEAVNKEEILKRGQELFQSKDKKIDDWQ